MRQKLAIIRALVHEPKVIFLDEPTSGLDPEAARTVRDAVAELAAEGRTIVLCSHNLAEVERLCRRVAVVKGRLLALGPVAELRREGSALDIQLEGEASAHAPRVQALPCVEAVLVEGGRLRVMVKEESSGPDVVAALVLGGARVQSVARAARPLEEVYLELVQGRAAAPAGD
jgi:ABC-2 type transport system ATP-binding protein